MFCSQCGTPNSDNARFCRNCGFMLVSPAFQQEQRPAQVSSGQALAGILIFIVGAVFLGIMWALSPSDISPDIDGVVLIYAYLIFNGIIYVLLNLIKKVCHIRSRNFHFSVLSTLFVINTIFVPIWNGSLTAAYIALSAGLLINVTVAWFLRKRHGE